MVYEDDGGSAVAVFDPEAGMNLTTRAPCARLPGTRRNGSCGH